MLAHDVIGNQIVGNGAVNQGNLAYKGLNVGTGVHHGQGALPQAGGSIGRGFVFGILSGRAMRGDLESAVGQRVLPVVCLYD